MRVLWVHISNRSHSHMNPVFWFEIPADDNAKVAAFYEKAFGWKLFPLGEKGGGYTVVHTSETGDDGMPKEGNRINGGIFSIKDGSQPHLPNIVIATSDISAGVRAIKAAGGTVLGEPYEIPGYGTYVPFLDPEGTRSALMQPKMP